MEIAFDKNSNLLSLCQGVNIWGTAQLIKKMWFFAVHIRMERDDLDRIDMQGIIYAVITLQ